MTRKHYEMVAAVLRAEIEANPGPGGIAESARTATRRIAGSLADGFAADNPRFDAIRFMQAVEPPTAPLFEVVASGYVDTSEPGQVVITRGPISDAQSTPGNVHQYGVDCGSRHWCEEQTDGVYMTVANDTDRGSLPRMGENRLGADSVIAWDDLSDMDAHLDDVGE